MPNAKRKQKKVTGPRPSSRLAHLCRLRGTTVAALADQMGQARNVLYLAWEKPTRYSQTYARIATLLALNK